MSTEPTNTSLKQRIVSALVGDIASGDLAALISDTEAAIARAAATADEERAKAVDPVLSPDAATARETVQAAEFARDRLRTVLPRLQSRLREVQSDEELARWLPRQQAAEARRDELAAKLRDLYLPFVQAIVPLLLDIEDADQEIRLVNHEAPYKAKSEGRLLESVEYAARGPSASKLRDLQIVKDLRLPNWEGNELPIWPPHRPFILGMPTFILSGDPRLSTGDWWQVKQEEAQAAAERAAREDAERKAKALANYQGPRWWEGERAG
jgi:hypothetical protein